MEISIYLHIYWPSCLSSISAFATSKPFWLIRSKILVLWNILEIAHMHHASSDVIGSQGVESQSHHLMHDVYLQFPVYFTTIHWNHCIWSQELWEHKFLVLKKVLLFYRSMLRLSFQRSCDHIQWFQWLQVVVHHRYVTLVRCHMHWSSQKCLEVLIISTNVMHH